MKSSQILIFAVVCCLMANQAALSQPILPNWAEALEAANTCEWISNAGSEPPEDTDPWDVNGRFVTALMIMARAGWCCIANDPSDGCDFDHDGTRDVLPDPAFPFGDCTIGDGDFWHLLDQSSAVNTHLLNSGKWYNELPIFPSSYWEDGGAHNYGASVDESDIILVGFSQVERANRTYVARQDGIHCSACERPGVSVQIEDNLHSLDNLIKKARGPFGANISDSKVVKILMKGSAK